MIYHSEIEYEPFNKDFYEESEDIAKMSVQEVVDYRKDLRKLILNDLNQIQTSTDITSISDCVLHTEIRVSGAEAARPVKTFEQLQLGDVLMKAIKKQGFTDPTPIQVSIPSVASILNTSSLLGFVQSVPFPSKILLRIKRKSTPINFVFVLLI